jgi:hypothetical protein
MGGDDRPERHVGELMFDDLEVPPFLPRPQPVRDSWYDAVSPVFILLVVCDLVGRPYGLVFSGVGLEPRRPRGILA